MLDESGDFFTIHILVIQGTFRGFRDRISLKTGICHGFLILF